MEQTTFERNSRFWREEIKRLADAGEKVVPIPPVVKPVQVEVALAIILIQHEDVAVAIRVQH